MNNKLQSKPIVFKSFTISYYKLLVLANYFLDKNSLRIKLMNLDKIEKIIKSFFISLKSLYLCYKCLTVLIFRFK